PAGQRSGDDRRFRHRAGVCRRGRRQADADGAGGRDARLHEPRAGERLDPARRPQRHLQPRLRVVRDARGEPAVHGIHAPGDSGAPLERSRAAAAHGAAQRAGVGRASDLARAREGAGGPVRHRHAIRGRARGTGGGSPASAAVARCRGRSSGGDARAVAVDLGAGRYLRGEGSHIGGSVRVYAALYDVTRGGSFVRDGTVKLGSNLARSEAAFAALGERLLFGSAGPGARVESQTGTSSFPARQAYAQGHAAIERWDLAAADSAFAAATRFDPQYAQAFLWLAQTRSWMAQGRAWSDTPVATWQSAAERAAAGRARLSSRDQLLSDALLALGRGEVDRACRVWTRLTVVDPYDFASWYGLGNCLSRDD